MLGVARLSEVWSKMHDPIVAIEDHRKETERIGCYSYNRHQSYCFGPAPISCKTAARLFDRIYVDAFDYQPLSLLKKDFMDESACVYSNLDPKLVIEELAPTQIVFLDKRLTSATSLALYNGRGYFSASLEEVEKFYSKYFVAYAREQGFHLMPVFQASPTPEKTEGIGADEAWSVLLERVPLVDTSN